MLRGWSPARTLGVGLLVVVWLVGAAPMAAAHLRTQEATNLESRILAEPEVPGMRWWLDPSGRRLALEGTGPGGIVVLGYEGEPYLRFGPTGVHANARSPATYLNARPDIDPVLPPVVDPSAPPEWVRVSVEPRYAWHDRRVGWFGPDPDAERDSGAGVLRRWTVEVVADGRTAELVGELRWVPGPPPWRPPLVGLVVVGAVLGLAARRGRTAMLRASALTVGGVALLNVAHLVDEVATRPVLSLDAATGVGHTALFVGAGIGAAWWSLRSPRGARGVLAAGSAAVLLHQGLLQLPVLWSSTFPTVWPPELVRSLVGLSLAQVVAVGACLAVVRTAPPVASVRAPHGWRRSATPV